MLIRTSKSPAAISRSPTRSTITCTRKIESLHLDYPKIIEAHVILEVEKYRHSAEVILVCSNHITIEACEETDDMYAAIDAVIDKSRGRCGSTRRG